MKRFFTIIIIALVFISGVAFGTDNSGLDIRLVAQNDGDVTEDVHTLMVKRLEQALRTSGVTLNNNEPGHLEIKARFVNTGEAVEPGPTPKYIVGSYLTLEAKDLTTGKPLASKAFLLKGAGSDVRRAYINAMIGIDSHSLDFKQFIHDAELRIISGFNRNYKTYLEKARKAAAKKDYAQAIYLTTIIPSGCKGAAEAEEAALSYYQKYVDKEGAKLLSEAGNVLKGKHDSATQAKAYTLLSGIDSSASCYAEAQELMKKIPHDVIASNTPGSANLTDNQPTTLEKAREIGRNHFQRQKELSGNLHQN